MINAFGSLLPLNGSTAAPPTAGDPTPAAEVPESGSPQGCGGFAGVLMALLAGSQVAQSEMAARPPGSGESGDPTGEPTMPVDDVPVDPRGSPPDAAPDQGNPVGEGEDSSPEGKLRESAGPYGSSDGPDQSLTGIPAYTPVGRRSPVSPSLHPSEEAPERSPPSPATLLGGPKGELSPSFGPGLETGSDPDAPLAVSGGSLKAEGPAATRESMTVDRDPEKLNPEFRGKLERVIHRMAQEYGHSVTLVEGFRTQSRQAALYAQGRTRPGPVATWTQNSLHSKGLAADLQVDGSWNNPRGYAHLQAVAQEEGLRVLGDRDPGHVEWPARGHGNSASTPSEPGVVPSLQVPTPARVARVAGTARVARPASVPGPGSTLPPTTPTETPVESGREVLSPEPARRGSVVTPTEVPGLVPAPSRPRSPGGGREQATVPPSPAGAEDRLGSVTDEEPPEEGQPALPARPGSDRGPTPSVQALSGEGAKTGGIRSPRPVEAAQGSDSAARAQEIQSLAQAWEGGRPGRILLDLQDADGAGTRLRLALRGAELTGSMDLEDPALAGRIRQKIGELHESLFRRGLDARALDAQTITALDGRGRADGDMPSLVRDPLAGLGRFMEAGQTESQTRADGGRSGREGSERSWERTRDAPNRERNKERER